MKTKGDRTKECILTEAKKLFAKSGYSNVTMKDICDVCNLSRGGLYRYFGSVKDIFVAVLDEDRENQEKTLARTLKSKASAKELLDAFLLARKERLVLGNDQGIVFAIQDFAHAETGEQHYVRQRYEDMAKKLSLLLQSGQEQGVFNAFDINSAAMHILLLLDSLETNSAILSLTEEEIDNQFQLLYNFVQKNTHDADAGYKSGV